ncbi:unnamed protein product [Mytilus coruscus]|uniref:Uncharacterized protein n=1 Tax=Mytilus coruscus TaxID=42192 RepID=A0A6J8D078_MYTCO|nr:unnamed protein product [Mytilus coruscus]
MNDTPNKAGLKRELSFSPSDISPSQIQVGKSAKTIPDSPSPNSSLQVSEMSQPTNISAQGETVLQLSEVNSSIGILKQKETKNNEDKLFISENLTKYRYGLMKHLNVLRFTEKIHSFWTHDGKIIAKETPESDYIVILCNQDIRDLGGEISDEDDDY